MVTTNQSSRKGQSTTNSNTPKKASRHDFDFFALCPELRNLIYTYAFSNSGAYYLEDLGVVTFHTINQETSDEINIMQLHVETKNPSSLTLWSLVSFAMLFVDEDYLLRPARVDAQRELISKAGEAQVAEQARRLREDEGELHEGSTLDMDKRLVEDVLGTDTLRRLLHPHYSTVGDMGCGLVVTYSACETEATGLALVHVPGTGWQLPKAADVANLLRLVHSIGEDCARKKIKDEGEVREIVWRALMDLDHPMSPYKDLMVNSVFKSPLRRRLPGDGVAFLSDLEPYWAKEMGYAERGRRLE
ncbi:hypothetical protein KC318_g4311 [Hortaea werneckii]|nr:hypothetical protein KC334_g4496 [Hortaea werneckii]KAI7015022.1 hypothetical protein KC355_g4473 [Hortaea werneckii]KAI7669964.1 hypothetical protein KC318_g4311 [Hortaea werneckii]